MTARRPLLTNRLSPRARLSYSANTFSLATLQFPQAGAVNLL